MHVIALQYHDVIRGGDLDASGAPGPDAATYKLTLSAFAAHIAAVSAVVPASLPRWDDVLAGVPTGDGHGIRPHAAIFTFDDGGVSAYESTAELLESCGWRGVFFVTTDWIGRPGFLDESQIRELDRRGHVIGAHSCSHPLRFARCTRAEMVAEWTGSVQRLGEVLGHEVSVASVPGGYYSRAVAEVASECGIRTLFTSEPEMRVRHVNGCRVVGRYTFRSWSSARTAGRIAAGDPVPRLSQWLAWNGKKIGKSAWGGGYLRLRRALLDAAPSDR